MLKKGFNKFGGTEFRVASQVYAYTYFFRWIKSVKELLEKKNQGKSKEDLFRELEEYEWDKEFKEWAFKEHIYFYKSKKHNFNRFQMLITNLRKLGVFDKNKPFWESLNKDIDKNSIFESMQNYENDKGVKPFKALLEFVHDNPNKNNAKKIILAFLVFDGEETFNDLYETDILKALIKDRDKDSLPHFSKPLKSIKHIEKVFDAKMNNKKLSLDDFKDYCYEGERYLKRTVFKRRQRFNLHIFVEKLNQMSLTSFIKKIYIAKYENLLLSDYFDLFSRWLYDFSLIDCSGRDPSEFFNSRVILRDGLYLLNLPLKKTEYPYSYKETISYLEEISKGKLGTYKLKDEKLKITADSLIAEYFVNLFYCYCLKIEPEDFNKYSRTNVNEDLMPQSHAPGGGPDMFYKNNEAIVIIETTLHATVRNVEKNEVFQCTYHLWDIIEKEKHEFNKQVLVFVSPVMKNNIFEVYNKVLQHKIKNADLLIYTFGELEGNIQELLDIIKE